MQETDLPATNAFKGTSTTNMRVCVCVLVSTLVSLCLFSWNSKKAEGHILTGSGHIFIAHLK